MAASPAAWSTYDEVLPHFREATWEEALDLRRAPADRDLRRRRPRRASPASGRRKCSNEEAYLFQKLIRTGFRTNNVDHCTRLCHASSVAALFEGIGSGAVSTTYGDIDRTPTSRSSPAATRPPTTRSRRRSSSRRAAAAPRSSTSTRGPTRWPSTPTSSASSSPAPMWRFYNGDHARGDPARPDRPRLHREPHLELRRSWPRPVADYPPERAEQITGVRRRA